MSESLLAWRFGTSGIVDAYRITVLLLLYGQQLFVTALLPFVLVPLFADCRSQGREEDAWAIADSLARILLVFGAIISAGLFFWPGAAIRLIAPGLTGEARVAAVFFLHWCGLGFLPICWTGAACGILYAYDVIQVGALAQLTSNLIMALAIGIAGGRLGANSLVVGVIGGAIASTCICSYKLQEVRRKSRPLRRGLISIALLRRAAGLTYPLLAAIIIGQATSVVVNRVISHLGVGSLAAFGYAFKMGIFVQLVPTAFTTVLFPKLAENWFASSREEFVSSCVKALRCSLFVAIPIAFVCYAQRTNIIAVLFGRGAFQMSDVQRAGALFGLMLLGSPASAVTVSLSRAFYAAQKVHLPVTANVFGNICELGLIPLLASWYGLNGVAFAYGILPIITGSVLLICFFQQNPSFPSAAFMGFILKTVAIGIPCVWLATRSAQLLCGSMQTPFTRSLLEISITSALATIAYIGIALTWRLREAEISKQIVFKIMMGTRATA